VRYSAVLRVPTVASFAVVSVIALTSLAYAQQPTLDDPSADGDFHTTFTFDEQNVVWHWTMDAEQSGTRRPFARLTMTKLGTP